ncbi:MAG: transglutaminase-like domain-containing protein [Candidatus Woesearchaeota archaeon]
MIADWYEDGFNIGRQYGETALVEPGKILFIPAKINLRAIIESESKIKTRDDVSSLTFDREVPSLFWKENLIAAENNTYVFETKYCKESDEVLPRRYLKDIPERLANEFLREVPQKFSGLAAKIAGNEVDSRKMLWKFYEFVHEHLRPKRKTTGKPLKQLMEEYEAKGCFYGNCKEARDFYAALCNSKGFPTKKVMGKVLKPGGHVWVDVFVPTDRGYKLLPVDPALSYFGSFSRYDHIFFESLPRGGGLLKAIEGLVKPKENMFRLTILKAEGN